MKTKESTQTVIDRIKESFGLPADRILDLSHMRADVGRLGYPDEGLRVTFAIGCPFDFHAEVQLSRADAEWLVARITAELNDPKNTNLPVGSRRAHD